MEILDICDENGRPTGETAFRELAHRDGLPHRTAHIWVVREKGGRTEILLQKRSRDKESFPGMYDTSAAGHIPAGEEPLPAALRELREELGIAARPEQLSFAGTFHGAYEKVFRGKLFRDNEYTHVYVYREPVEIAGLRLQREEVEQVRWFALDAVVREIGVSRARICVSPKGLDVLCGWLRAQGAPHPGESPISGNAVIDENRLA